MSRLLILGSGESPQQKNNAKGKLFEKLMSEVIKKLGYSIDKLPNINYAGMEIDIEGKGILNNIPFYAECKYHDTLIATPKLQAFLGKYMVKWMQDNRSQAVFIAIPDVNSSAKGYYKEYIESNEKIAFNLINEDEIIQLLFSSEVIVNPIIFTSSVSESLGSTGDNILMYTEKGFFWIQFIIPKGGSIASSIIIYDRKGYEVTDKGSHEYLADLWTELSNYDIVSSKDSEFVHETMLPKKVEEEIVEVQGSSSCFEYQFPASPEFFIGRSQILSEVEDFFESVINKKTTSRSILYIANSGWGKSSLTLSTIAKLQEKGHFAIAIDSRSASSTQFVLKTVEYTLNKFNNFDGLMDENIDVQLVSGFESAASALTEIGKILEKKGKLLCIFFDQFENIFFQKDILNRVKNLFLKLQDSQTNLILGFSWKTDLVGFTDEFPYKIRDLIFDSSNVISVHVFSNLEINELVDRLSKEIRKKLREDLRFFLSEFSQGYPWLLKKLCFHVKNQIEQGASQVDIANSLLNIKELFQEDLDGLSADQEDALRKISFEAPISVRSIDEEFSPEIIQSLVHRRILVRIGSKYDIYWDVFKDFLNSGKVPVQVNYIPRIGIRRIFQSTKLLLENKGSMEISKYQETHGITTKSMYNILRDLKITGIATVEDGRVKINSNLIVKSNKIEEQLRLYLKEKLPQNRLVWSLLKVLDEKDEISVNEAASYLEQSCPFISALNKTWLYYAKLVAEWMDFSDLAIYETKEELISKYTLEEGEKRRRDPILSKRFRSELTLPPIQYGAIKEVATRIVTAYLEREEVNWKHLSRTTIGRALSTLEKFDFIKRGGGSIVLKDGILKFILSPEGKKLFADEALKIKSFNTFINLLYQTKDNPLNMTELAKRTREILNASWKISTSIYYTKVLLNWVRKTNLAPDEYLITRRNKKFPS